MTVKLDFSPNGRAPLGDRIVSSEVFKCQWKVHQNTLRHVSSSTEFGQRVKSMSSLFFSQTSFQKLGQECRLWTETEKTRGQGMLKAFLAKSWKFEFMVLCTPRTPQLCINNRLSSAKFQDKSLLNSLK